MPTGYPRNPKPVEKRFWEKVDRKSPDECWLWRAAKSSGGYGTFGYQGKTAIAHRIAYQLTYGQIPDDICVCHRCDVPSCCNPNHLFLGTHSDNNQDTWNKGRHPRTTHLSRYWTKLSEEEVRQIRLLHQQGMRNVDIAALFHVRPSATSRIINGKRRKAVS